MSTALLTLAFVAGAVAAFNPCGFALLPAYLSLLVAAPDQTAGRAGQLAAIGRAGRFTAGMTLGFVAVFGLFGVVAAPFAYALQRHLPVVTVVVGGALVATGAWLLADRSLTLPLLTRRGRAPGTSCTGTWTRSGSPGRAFPPRRDWSDRAAERPAARRAARGGPNGRRRCRPAAGCRHARRRAA